MPSKLSRYERGVRLRSTCHRSAFACPVLLTSSARNPNATAAVTHSQLGTMDGHKLSCRLPPITGANAHAMPTSIQTHAGVAPPPPVSLVPSPPTLGVAPAASEEMAHHMIWENDHNKKHSSDMPSQARRVSRQKACTTTGGGHDGAA